MIKQNKKVRVLEDFIQVTVPRLLRFPYPSKTFCNTFNINNESRIAFVTKKIIETRYSSFPFVHHRKPHLHSSRFQRTFQFGDFILQGLDFI